MNCWNILKYGSVSTLIENLLRYFFYFISPATKKVSHWTLNNGE